LRFLKWGANGKQLGLLRKMKLLQSFMPFTATTGALLMDQRELQFFLHLSKSLSFAKTSAASHVTPSSLSRVIQRLEKEIGHPLFERDSRRVKLTNTGKSFRLYAEQTCNSWTDFLHSLHEQATNLQGELSLFCSVTASYSFLDEILGRFRAQHTGIEIKLHTGDSAVTLERISAELEDIGIAALPERIPSQFQIQELTQTPLVFIAPLKARAGMADLVTADTVRWADVPLIMSESGLVRERADRWFRSMQVKPTVYAQVSGHEAIVSMVGLGFGVGIVPRIVLENSPLAAKVKEIEMQHAMRPIAIGLCVLKRKLNNPLIKAFWTLAGQSIADNMQL
jgi:LysR family transcriptional regulator, positive regulator for ilvC